MSKSTGQSMFTMDDVNEIVRMPIAAAKAKVCKIISESTANRANRSKAERMMNKSRTSVQLAQAMSNFILAHPENDLRVS